MVDPDLPLPNPRRLRLEPGDGRRLLLLGVASALALVLGFLTFDAKQAAWIIRWLGLPILWILALLATGSLVAHVRALRRSRPAESRNWRRMALRAGWVAFVSLLLHVHLDHRFKVLDDEVVLLGTSMAIHKERQIFTPSFAEYMDGAFKLGQGYVDKRPYLFPFLLSLVHDVTGFRPSNGIWLNAALTPVLVWLVFLLGARIAGNRGGFLASLLLAGLPLLFQNTTGGGFELLNLVLLCAVMLLGIDLLRHGRQETIAAFATWGGLLAFCRYESVLYVLAVGAVILVHWWRQRRPVIPLTLCAVPLLLVPFPLIIRIVQSNVEGYFQLATRDDTEAFGFHFLPVNLEHAAAFFFHGEGILLNSTPLFVVGAIGIIAFLVTTLGTLARGRSTSGPSAVMLAFGTVAAINLFILFCYHWGQLDDPIVARIALPHHLFFALAATWLVRAVGRRISRTWPVAFLGGAAALLVVGIPTASNHHLERLAAPIRIQEIAEAFVEAQPRKDFLMITRLPLKFISQEVYTYSFKVVNRVPDGVMRELRQGGISAVYAFQEVAVDPETLGETVAPETRLSPRYVTEVVSEHVIKSGMRARFVRIVDLLPEETTVVDTAAPAP